MSYNKDNADKPPWTVSTLISSRQSRTAKTKREEKKHPEDKNIRGLSSINIHVIWMISIKKYWIELNWIELNQTAEWLVIPIKGDKGKGDFNRTASATSKWLRTQSCVSQTHPNTFGGHFTVIGDTIGVLSNAPKRIIRVWGWGVVILPLKC
jgi:hypothetical protein